MKQTAIWFICIAIALGVLAFLAFTPSGSDNLAPTIQAIQTEVSAKQGMATSERHAPTATATVAQGEREKERPVQIAPTATSMPTRMPTPVGVVTATSHAVTVMGLSGVRVTFRNARWLEKMGDFRPSVGYRWLAVDVVIENPAGNSPVDYSPLWFSLLLSDGEEALPVPLWNELMSLAELKPGQRLSGTLVFNVPALFAKHQSEYTLEVDDAPLSGKPPMVVAIKVAQ